MKTIKVSRQSKALNVLLRRARHENVILRSADGDEFILADIDDFNREIELTRKNKQLMRLLDRRAKQKPTVSLSETRRRLRIER
jgi:hypothetical protein